MVLARSRALSAVAAWRAAGLARQENTVRQQWREFGYEATAKRGAHRQEVRVESCFAPWLGWGLSWGEGEHLALAVAATALGARLVGWAVRVG